MAQEDKGSKFKLLTIQISRKFSQGQLVSKLAHDLKMQSWRHNYSVDRQYVLEII